MTFARCFGLMIAGALSLGLGGCFIAAPEDMEIPGPDGRFMLRVDFEGGGLTLKPGLGAKLSLAPTGGPRTEFAALPVVRGLEVVWMQPRDLRICIQGGDRAGEESVSVQTPEGPASFRVTYVCPARPAVPGA